MKKNIDSSENNLSIVDTAKTEEYKSKFWGQKGSGILCISASTGRILLMHRSELVNEPGTWGIPGGKVDDEEKLTYSALRELQEETGYDGTIQLFESYIFKEDTFEYHNFLGVVATEFEVQLNWESTDAKWFAQKELPENLHFGVEILLKNANNQIRDLLIQLGHCH